MDVLHPKFRSWIAGWLLVKYSKEPAKARRISKQFVLKDPYW
jgi:hypothetical protein